MKTVLVFVLSCNKNPYPSLTRASIETWDSLDVDGVNTFYYTANPPAVKHPNVIGFDVDDGYNGLGHKNIAAFEYAIASLKWDYMARVNASCYVRKQLLFEECQSLPKTEVFRGVKVVAGKPFLWGGAQFIFSRDVVQKIIDNKNKWNHGPTEDVAISDILFNAGIHPDIHGRSCSINKNNGKWTCIAYGDNAENFEFTDMQSMHKANNQYFIRVKQDLRRDIDVQIMKELHLCGL